jgi:hypothetical protein
MKTCYSKLSPTVTSICKVGYGETKAGLFVTKDSEDVACLLNVQVGELLRLEGYYDYAKVYSARKMVIRVLS